MNTRKHDDTAPAAGFDEREWQAQERARHGRREGHGDTGDGSDDAMARSYRAIDRALREPLMAAPPADFAAEVVRMAQAQQAVGGERLERWLIQVLVAVLGLSGGVASVLYGREWLQAIGSAVPAGTSSWLGLAMACAGLYWAIERWRGHRDA